MIRKPSNIINSTSKRHIIHLINKCKDMGELKQIHAQIIKEGNSCPHGETPLDVLKLVSFCAISPHGNLAYAKTIFYGERNPSVELYNSLIRGTSSSKHPLEALLLYQRMLNSGLQPNNFTYPFLIKACIESSRTQYGILVHTQVVKCGLESDSYIQSSLIRFYATGKDLRAAKQLFDMCSATDLVSWNSLIDGYVKSGFYWHQVGRVEGEVFNCMTLYEPKRIMDIQTGKSIYSSSSFDPFQMADGWLLLLIIPRLTLFKSQTAFTTFPRRPDWKSPSTLLVLHWLSISKPLPICSSIPNPNAH
ncbi:hypothetical protein U1Q18_007722 [Sarracenia purpurea var. burkii]